MSETKRVQPAKGLLVRHENPTHGHIPPEGEDVVMSRYYRRRLRDGDLIVAAPKPKPAKGV